MRKLTFYLILLFLAAFMNSCEIKAPSSNDDDEENFLYNPTPYDNEIGVSLQPTLYWNYNANTPNLSFTIYLDTVSTQMDSIAFVNSNSYNLPVSLVGNKTYYWQVRTTYEGETYISNVWRFTTTATGGILLNNPYPPDNATGISLTPQLSWNYNGSDSIYIYEVYMDTNYPPNTYIGYTPTPNYSITTPLQSGKTYFWKIRAYTYNGPSESNVWRFTTTGSGGTLLSNPNPPDSSKGVSLTPQLSWQYNGSNTIYYYNIYMDTFNPPNKYLGQTNTPNYYVSTPLQSGTTYYWKIIAYTNNGTPESSVWRFTTLGGLPTNGLVAYYPFSGNTIDSSGYLNHGQNNGATLTMDRFYYSNKAYWFNGSNSYINVTHTSSLQPTNGITLSAWVKLNTLNRSGSILAKGSANAVGLYTLKYDSLSHKLDFKINFSDNNPGTVSSYTTPQTYQWYNVIGTFDGSIMKIYINGQYENSSYMSKTLGNNFSDLKIGRCAEGLFLNGDLDDIRIYNRALIDSEIQQLFHEGGWSKK